MSEPTDARVRDLVERLRPELGALEGLARAARGRDHQPQLPGPRSPASDVRRAAAGQGHRAAGDRPRGRARGRTRWPPSAASAPEVVAMLDDPPCLVTRFVVGEPIERGGAARAGGAGRGGARRCGRSTPAGSAAGRVLDAFRIVEAYAARIAAPRRRASPSSTSERWRAARRDRSAALSGPEHEPVPCHNDLLAANFIRSPARACGSSTGSTRGWATATSTSATSRSTTSSTRTTRRRLLAAYFGEPRHARGGSPRCG